LSLLQRLWNLAFGPRDGDPLPKEQAVTTKQRALEVAKEWTEREGLPWLEPVEAEFLHTPEGPVWWIRTNTLERGFSVRVVVDDGTGKVRGTTVLPR
jgi:hypothetical protein